MAEDARVLVLDDKVDLSKIAESNWPSYRAIVCLFWLAPSTKDRLSRLSGGHCIGLSEIIDNDLQGWGQDAYDHVAQIVESGPRHDGLYWRSYLTEGLYHEHLRFELLVRTARYIQCLRHEWNLSAIVIDGNLSSRAEGCFKAILNDYGGLVYRSSQDSVPADAAPLSARLRQRLKEVQLTGNAAMFIGDLIAWLDKSYYWHCQMGRWLPNKMPSEGGITFFSSYLNNTRTLASFADQMPMPVHWVVANESARQGLPPDAQPAWLWQFGSRSQPGYSRKRMDVETGLQAWVTNSDVWQNWQNVEFALLANLTQCWESYLDQAQPRLIVTANQWSIEGWLMRIASQRNIPVLQLMHGAVGGYLYTRTPLSSDKLVVWGDFWRDLWPKEEQSQIVVYNPGRKFAPVQRQPNRAQRRVSFVSWPLAEVPYYNQSELLDGFIHLFQRLSTQMNCDVTLRFHPRENPGDMTERWQALYGAIPANVEFSKNEPLDDVLARTAVAVMFHSTVMLNCIASRIPVIIPGWTDFGWNQALKDKAGVYLALNWADLERCLSQWLEQPPETAEDTFEYFISQPGLHQESFRLALEQLLSSANFQANMTANPLNSVSLDSLS